MTKTEAMKMLDQAPCGESPSRINPGFTQADAVRIVRAGIQSPQTPDPFDGLFEKRVWQVYKNQKRPKFEKQI